MKRNFSAVAPLLCNICSHRWTKTVHFSTLAEIERYDFNTTPCPNCGAESCLIVPVKQMPDAAAGFTNEVDADDPADAWKLCE